MNKANESYTVVVLPDPTSKPYRFNIRKKTARLLVGFLSAAFLIVSGLLTHYVFLVQGKTELKTLRKETVVQKRQLQDFATQMTDFKKQMVRLKEMDAKLRIMTDINPPSESSLTLGMGGAETTGLSDIEIGIPSELLASKMDEEVKILKTEASRQEVSFEELAQDMKERKSLWESTPSIWPVKGWLSSGFGKRISPFTSRLTMHNGIDIATRQNTPIIAPADGLVNHMGYHSRLGKLVKINHGHGIQTIYGHLAKAEVRVGQKVKRGDVIGLVGNTGVSTGPHVHYEVFVNGLPVNPLRYIIN
jgi:murein DD-endopeptidase MepM/ murein hydrolase activator NlpD